MSEGALCIHELDPRTCATCLHGPEPAVERSDRGNSTCKSCTAEIIWVVTEKGARMPLDATSSGDGQFIKSHLGADGSKHVRFLKRSELEANTKPLYTSHFATCPNAKEHRRS